jgi:hypothetical protein
VLAGVGRRVVYTHIVVIFPTEVCGIDVHSAVISPVVGQSDDEFHSSLLSRCHYLVKRLDVNFNLAIVPPLHDIWVVVASILRKTSRDGRSVPVIEAPSTEHVQTGFLSGCKALLDI